MKVRVKLKELDQLVFDMTGVTTCSKVMSRMYVNVNIYPLSCSLPREMNIYVNVFSSVFFCL